MIVVGYSADRFGDAALEHLSPKPSYGTPA